MSDVRDVSDEALREVLTYHYNTDLVRFVRPGAVKGVRKLGPAHQAVLRRVGAEMVLGYVSNALLYGVGNLPKREHKALVELVKSRYLRVYRLSGAHYNALEPQLRPSQLSSSRATYVLAPPGAYAPGKRFRETARRWFDRARDRRRGLRSRRDPGKLTAADVEHLPVGSIVLHNDGYGGTFLVVVPGGLAPISLLSERLGGRVPEGEPATQWGAAGWSLVAEGRGDVPTHGTAQRKAIEHTIKVRSGRDPRRRRRLPYSRRRV